MTEVIETLAGNTLELFHVWGNEWIVEINGKRFMIFHKIVDYTKDLNPIIDYFVVIAPEYNPSGKVNVFGHSRQGLIKNLSKLPYKISTI